MSETLRQTPRLELSQKTYENGMVLVLNEIKNLGPWWGYELLRPIVGNFESVLDVLDIISAIMFRT